jgi:hypothetical protein
MEITRDYHAPNVTQGNRENFFTTVEGAKLICTTCGSEAVMEVDAAFYPSCQWVSVYMICENFGCGSKVTLYESSS